MAVSRAFRRKQRAQFANGWRLFCAQSRLKVLFIFAFAMGCEAGLWILFADGFNLLDRFGGVSGLIMGRLFSLFYLGMGAMLVMSGVVTSYATLYRSDEVPHLLVQPLPVAQVVVYKFFQSAFFSSWAFLFVIIPFVGAYAQHERVSLEFGFWTAVFSVPFLVICSGIGTLVIQVLVRWWPRRLGLKPWLIAAACAGVVIAWRATRAVDDGDGAKFALGALVPGLRLSANMMLPSTWVAEGIVSLTRGEWGRGLLLLGTILSTAAALVVFIEALGEATFLHAWEQVAEGGRRAGRPAAIFRWGDRLLARLPGDMRALIMKDIRTFFRDPMQWSQVLIFFGLLGMYFANLRRFHYNTYSPEWRNLVCFLNVFSVSSVLCSLGARFIYPQPSLEGQGFWLLGLAPTSMRRILFAKFVLALACTGLVSVVLIGMSSAMLAVEPLLLAVSLGLVSCIVIGICALSTGLGAVFLDLRQRNPAAIVGGFGGTVNLVLSLGFMLATILPFGLAFHLRAGGSIDADTLRRGLVYACAWCLLLTAAVGITPMALGIRSLRARDY